MAWQFHENDLDSADVQRLLADHFRQMRDSSPPDACHVLPVDGLRFPSVTFWSLRRDANLLSVGALKDLGDGHGEVKPMRAAPASIGKGAGRAMLEHIIAEARRRGYGRLSLETGSTKPFLAALRLYERNGFLPCGPFACYQATAFTRFMSRRI